MLASQALQPSAMELRDEWALATAALPSLQNGDWQCGHWLGLASVLHSSQLLQR